MPVILLAACVADGPGAEPGVASAPRGKTTYRCDDGARMAVENRGTSVILTLDDNAPVTLPASPADSRIRYGAPPYALLLDRNEALLMKSGAAPNTCRR
ncbi:MliC family protein [Nitratireductor alexandrii]|uniref:MliC family protein n=1 Tax=Nitratireductor alexandrii TaxID=2448161 RepID=UPI000FDC0C6B|nr:MliC family protein [Nitratireductor alexandrii]